LKKTATIQIFDNVVTNVDDCKKIATAIWKCPDYQISTSDSSKWDAAIFVGTFNSRPDIQDLLWSYVEPYCMGEVPKKVLINAHPANQPGAWHNDDKEGYWTALYYPWMGKLWPPTVYEREGGLEMEGYGTIQYRDNTLVLFPAHIRHRTLNHEAVGKIRFSVAHKLDNYSLREKEHG
jgi:hypothetical protein